MKKTLRMILLLAVMVCALCVTAGAEELSGTCGAKGNEENVTWTLDTETGLLTISGTGAMKDYRDYDCAPWHEQRTYVHSAVVGEGITSIGDDAFYDCSSLTSISLPEGITSIGSYAFWQCSSLTSISLPEGITSIGSYAFWQCSSLTSISLPESVTSIGRAAFSGCSSLTAISLPESVTSIGDSAFQYCSNLTSISLPQGITSIGDYAFDGCSSLTSISLPQGVTSIGDYAFDSCSSLTSIELPAELAIIGKSVFSWCWSLEQVVIPEKVVTIEESAFQSCHKLKTLSLPKSVKTIQLSAFIDCSALEEVYYGGSEEDWNAIFIGINNEPLLNAKRYVGGVLQPSKAAISGTVSGLSAGACAILMQNGAELAQAAVVNGSFAFTDLAAGTYDVVIQCPACLNCTIQGIALSGEDVTLAPVPLTYGDLNGDQKINIGDMGIFRQNFGKTAANCIVNY